MKKILIIIMIMVLTYSIPVKAKGETGGGSGQSFGELVQEFDNMGRVKKGEVLVICPTNDGKDEIRVRYVSSDYCFVSYTNSGEKTENGIDIIRYYLRCYDVETLSIDKSYKYDYYWDYYSEGAYDYGNVSKGEEAVSLELGFKPLYDITTTFPVFNEDDENFEENLRKYFEEGDPEGLDEPLYPPPTYDDEIELPHNFKVLDGVSYLNKNRIKKVNKDVIIKWEQTVDTTNYQYDVFVSLQYDDVSNELDNLSTIDVLHSNSIAYSGSKNISVTISQDWINNLLDDAYSHQHMLLVSGNPQSTCYLRSMIIKVRNKSGGKCSNFVETKINFTDKTASASEKDASGNTVDNAEYDNTDVINGDDDIDGANVGKLSDFTSIINYIKSGFGIFQKGGLVDLMSSFFGNIFPPMFWNLILLGFGVIILIGIINFLLKR